MAFNTTSLVNQMIIINTNTVIQSTTGNKVLPQIIKFIQCPD